MTWFWVVVRKETATPYHIDKETENKSMRLLLSLAQSNAFRLDCFVCFEQSKTKQARQG
jgi:hypothetical protein